MKHEFELPVIGVVAYSGTGKTTTLCNLLPLLKARGLRVGMVKHAHHKFDVDKPGKDSFKLREAGADQVLLASRSRWALMVQKDFGDEPQLFEILPRLDTSELDMVLVEGFKHEPFPKIELHRPSLERPLLFPDDPWIVAVATDAPLPVETRLPILDLNQTEDIAQFFADFVHTKTTGPRSVETGAGA